MDIIIQNGTIIDPSQNLNVTRDIGIKDGKIAKIDVMVSGDAKKTIDATNMFVIPGIIDMHVHLREPGDDLSEDIDSGSRAAVSSGITSLVVMANTYPVIDSHEKIRHIINRANATQLVEVLPVSAITKNMDGETLVNFRKNKEAGAIAFSEDGKTLMDSDLLFDAYKEISKVDSLVISHCEDTNLSRDGHLNEGYVSQKLGLKGIPKSAEEIIVARNILLADKAGARIHIAHVSSKGSVEIIRWAKSRGIQVTAEVTPHHLTFTDKKILEQPNNTNFKMKPPLTEEEDIEALYEGLSDGTIDVIATDHAPHSNSKKNVDFELAAFGVIGMEALLPVTYTNLVKNDILSINDYVKIVSTKPAEILKIDRSVLKENAQADITIFNPFKEITINADTFYSKSNNCPFNKMSFHGEVYCTIKEGMIKYI